jgi:rod shape-determining protein MreC
MRLLFLLLWRNNFTLLFVIFQSFCIFLLVQNNKFQHASVLNATNDGVAKVMEGVSYVTDYIHLRDNNLILANENANLRNALKQSQFLNDSSVVSVRDTINKQLYNYTTAKVVNNSVSMRNNYLTLNKGSLDGIKPLQGVITASGVIGTVQQVSDHYCTVMSLLHTKSKLSAKLKKSNFFGSLVWDGENPREVLLKEIDKTVPVQKGDTVVTTGFSKRFPENVMIGVVSEAQLNPGSNFHSIKVRLSTRFDNLSYVYIVQNLMRNEQQALEDSTLSTNEE